MELQGVLDALCGFDMIWIIGTDAYTIASVRRDVVSAPISRQWNTVTNWGCVVWNTVTNLGCVVPSISTGGTPVVPVVCRRMLKGLLMSGFEKPPRGRRLCPRRRAVDRAAVKSAESLLTAPVEPLDDADYTNQT